MAAPVVEGGTSHCIAAGMYALTQPSLNHAANTEYKAVTCVQILCVCLFVCFGVFVSRCIRNCPTVALFNMW